MPLSSCNTKITFGNNNIHETSNNILKIDIKKEEYITLDKKRNISLETFDFILIRLTVVGSTYLVLVFLLPEFLISRYTVPFYFVVTSILIIFNSCAKDKVKTSVIKEKSLDGQVLEAYTEGLEALKSGDALFAAKKFNEAEMLFPQSEWASKSVLMASYSYYTIIYYRSC